MFKAEVISKSKQSNTEGQRLRRPEAEIQSPATLSVGRISWSPNTVIPTPSLPVSLLWLKHHPSSDDCDRLSPSNALSLGPDPSRNCQAILSGKVFHLSTTDILGQNNS